jgi:hypothetical protein
MPEGLSADLKVSATTKGNSSGAEAQTVAEHLCRT